MKQAKLRDWLEIIGILAVVVSLVFVGLQIRQTQDIAISDMQWNSIIAEIESRSAIYKYPDIWAKGNAGKTLTPTEAVIYSTLIRDFNSVQFYRVSNFLKITGDESALGIIISDTSGFLFDNPGARREWNALRDTFRRHREPHIVGELRSPFEEQVRAQLAVLDEMRRSNK